MDPERKIIFAIIRDVLISDIAGIVLSYIPFAKVKTLNVSPNSNPVCNICFGVLSRFLHPRCCFCWKRDVKLCTVLSLLVDQRELEIFRFLTCCNPDSACSLSGENVGLQVALPCMVHADAIWESQALKQQQRWILNERKRAISCCDAPLKRRLIAFSYGNVFLWTWILCCETHFAHLESILSLLPGCLCDCGMCQIYS